MNYTIPEYTFEDKDDSDLALSAQYNYQDLPTDELAFDGQHLYGTMEGKSRGVQIVTITATDSFNDSVSTAFSLCVLNNPPQC